jgi:SAD/SRA domain
VPGPVFGHIPGYPVGSHFENRVELADAGVHRHRQAGISGSSSQGADSIVLSGGYEDDEDHGDTIVYTGYGGGTPPQGSRSQISLSPCGIGRLRTVGSTVCRFGLSEAPVTTRPILPAPGTAMTVCIR